MQFLLAFAPFLIFAVVDRTYGVVEGLIAAAVVAGGMLIWESGIKRRSPKVLDVGTLLLFGGLAVFTVLCHEVWSLLGVRLCVDAGLLLIVLFSMAIRQPFTMQYAKESVPRELWDNPEFIRKNYTITGVWAAAFGVMVAADLVMLYVPTVPMKVGIWATVIAMIGAMKFTKHASSQGSAEKSPQ